MNKKKKRNKMIKEMERTKNQNNIERKKQKSKKNRQTKEKGIIQHHMIPLSVQQKVYIVVNAVCCASLWSYGAYGKLLILFVFRGKKGNGLEKCVKPLIVGLQEC